MPESMKGPNMKTSKAKKEQIDAGKVNFTNNILRKGKFIRQLISTSCSWFYSMKSTTWIEHFAILVPSIVEILLR